MLAGAALARYDNPYESGFSPSLDVPTARYDFLRASTAQQTVSKDLDEILEIAERSVPEMTDSAQGFAARVGGTVLSVNVKARDSAVPKVAGEYRGDAILLCDPVRATVIIPADNVDLARAVLALHESTCAVKDLIAMPSKTGLAIINAKVTLANGLKGEIQFVTEHMRQAMQLTHARYKKIDSLTKEFSKSELPEDIANEIKRLERDCVDLHATAVYLDGLDRYVDKDTTKAQVSPALV